MTDTTDINYYVLDEIKPVMGGYEGCVNGQSCEVYPFDGLQTEADLIKDGFAKCDDAKGQTFLIEESAYASLAQ